jgi:hypothetical protein
MTKKNVQLDPFTYGTWDTVTTLVQLAVAVAGVILAAKGDTSALLGLGALAGGSKGNLLGDLLRVVQQNRPKGPGPLAMAVLVLALVFPACGTAVTRQFVIDSQAAVLAASSDYLEGCQSVTVAPAFSVDWNQNVTYGGGLFAGCEAKGRLVEFRCVGVRDEESGKTQVQCRPLALWEQAKESP